MGGDVHIGGARRLPTSVGIGGDGEFLGEGGATFSAAFGQGADDSDISTLAQLSYSGGS